MWVCSFKPDRHGYWGAARIIHTEKIWGDCLIVEGRGQLTHCLICGSGLVRL